MNSNSTHYMEEAFEVNPVCNSRYSSPNTNILSRIQNAVASAINKRERLPEFMVVVLDDDLITFLDYKDTSSASLLGPWIEWLMNAINSLIRNRMDQLPEKAKIAPFIYWAGAPLHKNFSKGRNMVRTKYNGCIEAEVKKRSNMRMLKSKEHWLFDRDALVDKDKITELGMDKYWDSIDAAMKFNIAKRKLFLARATIADAAQFQSQNMKQPIKEAARRQEDEIPNFFKKYRQNRNDRYWWTNNNCDGNNTRFFMPKPKFY